MQNNSIKNNAKGQSDGMSLLIQARGKNSHDIALQKPYHYSSVISSSRKQCKCILELASVSCHK